MYGGENIGFLFVFKIYLIRHPKSFIVYSLFSTLIFFGFIIRVVERPIMETVTNPSLLGWDDIIWYCIITTSTIGYGDKVPFTLPGRFTAFFMILWGGIWTSLFVSTLNTALNLGENEMKVN